MYEAVVVGALMFVAVVSIGGAVIMAGAAHRKALRARVEGVEACVERAPPEGGPFGRALRSLGKAVSGGRSSQSLQEQLARAGWHHKSAAMVYLGTKVLLLVVGLVVPAVFLLPTGLSVPVKVLLILLGGVLLLFVPNSVVVMRHRKRREEVRHHLPDVVDLLEICVSSGMALDAAWNFVTDEIRQVSPTLADEMALANLEIHLGAPRDVALRHMAERMGGEDLLSLAGVLVQSERFGTSIAEALRIFATMMREDRGFRAQESAEKIAVKLLFPLVLFIFPAVFVVLAGPAAITLVKVMGTE
ncbi:MAG TPA: type II secretion system F family protein [Phycisphaerae bacterium]|nr:type II secretion system F family protein [Phycisphaerae bacterium]